MAWWRSRALAVGLTVLGVLVAACGAGSSAPASVADSGRPASARQAAGRVLAAVPSQPPGVATWAPWPAALHDARHSGSSTGDGPTSGILRWRRALEAAVTPGPVIGPDGTIYAGSNGGVLHALNPATGDDRWTFDGHRSGVSDLSTSPLVLPNGTVLWGSPGRTLYALSGAGALLWQAELPGQPTSPASADGQRVYVGDSSGSVSAFDVSPGGHRLVWTVVIGKSSFGSVVTDGAGRVYTTADSTLVAIDDRGDSAVVAWRADPGDDITEVSAGLAADGTILLGTNGVKEWAYDRSGARRWDTPRIITYSSPSVTASGLAYLGDHSGRVHVYDVRDGREAATYRPDTTGQIWTSVVVDRAYRAYFGTQKGHLYGIEPGGHMLFDLDLGSPLDSYPALGADGGLVIGTRSGTLVAIG